MRLNPNPGAGIATTPAFLGFAAPFAGQGVVNIADGTAAIKSAVATVAAAGGGVVQLPRGRIGWNATQSMDVDVSIVTIQGDGTEIVVSGAPSTYIWKLFSSQSYTTRYKQQRAVVSGVRMLGGPQTAPLAGKCWQLGTGAAPALQTCAIRDCHVEGFTTLIDFKDSTFIVVFDDCQFRWGNITTPTGSADFGERMVFNACQLDLLGDVQYQFSFTTGDWHFFGCSIDNTKFYIPAGGDAAVYVHGGHVENPQNPATSGYWAEIAADAGVIAYRGTHFVIGNPSLGGNYTTPLFKVVDTNTYGGFIFDNCYLPEPSAFVPESGSNYRTLVQGLGRVQVANATGFQVFNGYAIARSLSALGNQGFESGDFSSWLVPPSNSGAVSVQAVTVRPGSASGFAAQLVAAAGQYAAISQRAPVRPGQIVKAVPWAQTSAGSGTGHLGLYFHFYAADGTPLDSAAQSFKSIAPGNAWAVQKLFAIAPAGAAYVEITTDVTGGTNGITAYVSDALVNVL